MKSSFGLTSGLRFFRMLDSSFTRNSISVFVNLEQIQTAKREILHMITPLRIPMNRDVPLKGDYACLNDKKHRLGLIKTEYFLKSGGGQENSSNIHKTLTINYTNKHKNVKDIFDITKNPHGRKKW